MRMMMLAAAAVLSVGGCSAYAVPQGQITSGAVSDTAVTASTNSETTSPLLPNPWDGTESWDQWNHDHPDLGGGESGGS